MSLMSHIERYRRERAMERLFETAAISENQRQRIIDGLGHQVVQTVGLRDDMWRLVSATADISEPLHSIAFNLGDLASTTRTMASDLGRMAAVADWALPAIVEHLALTAQSLGGIEQMLANPAETAAAEFYRNGTYALASGWNEEAEEDLSAATERYRYNPRSWFNLGVARERIGDDTGAAEAYQRCARYGGADEPELAATAVLLAAGCHRRADQPEASNAILLKYVEPLDRCAEIHLALAVHHDRIDHLTHALALAPDMAVDALHGRAPGVEEAAAAVCRASDGPVRRLRDLEAAATNVLEVARSTDGFRNIELSHEVLTLPADGVDSLLRATTTIPITLAACTEFAAKVRARLNRMQAETYGAAVTDPSAGQGNPLPEADSDRTGEWNESQRTTGENVRRTLEVIGIVSPALDELISAAVVASAASERVLPFAVSDLGTQREPTSETLTNRGRRVAVLDAPLDRFDCVAFGPDGHLLATSTSRWDHEGKGWREHGIHLWNSATGDLLRTLNIPSQASNIAFMADGCLVAAGACATRHPARATGKVQHWDTWLRTWDPRTGDVFEHETHANSEELAFPAAFSPDGRLFATQKGSLVQLWNSMTAGHIRDVGKHDGSHYGIVFSSDATLLAAKKDDTVRLWDLNNGDVRDLRLRASGDDDSPSAEMMALSPDGKVLAACARQKERAVVRLWDVQTGEHLRDLGARPGVSDLAFSPSGDLLVAVSNANEADPITSDLLRTARLWDPNTGVHVADLANLADPSNRLTAVAFSPNGRLLAISCWLRNVEVWSPRR